VSEKVAKPEFGVFGHKWALAILQDVAFAGLTRFSDIQRSNPGLTPRVLSRRLAEMCEHGILRKDGAGPAARYALTPRGEDAAFILLALLRYGARHGEAAIEDAARRSVPPASDRDA
jgi:DNA-binding HxlR family transcriptional regulator